MQKPVFATLRHSILLSVALLGSYTLCTKPVLAVTITSTTPLPNALAQESMDLNVLSATAIQNGIGTLNYNSNPGCAVAGACYATTTLNGPAGGPAVMVNIGQQPGNGAGGGSANYAEIYYLVSYNGTGPVTINMSDTLNAPGALQQAQAYFGFALASSPPFSGPISYGVGYIGQDGSTGGNLPIYNVTDCVGGCISNVGVNNGKPLGNIYNVNMSPGAIYLVDIWVDVAPANGVASAELDPTFTAPNGTFTFSPGVQSGVPELSTWAMLVVGFAGVGFMACRRNFFDLFQFEEEFAMIGNFVKSISAVIWRGHSNRTGRPVFFCRTVARSVA